MYSDTLKNYFPQIVIDSKISTEILNSQGIEFDNYYAKLSDLVLQFSVDTATWALAIYEKDLNILTDHTKNYDSRRRVIKSKWHGNGKFSSELIKAVCYAFITGNISVTFDGIIHIYITVTSGISSTIDDLQEIINQIKPAYILVDYRITSKTSDVLNINTFTLCGEEIRVFPYQITNIESNGEIDIALGQSSGAEIITVGPKEE